MYCQNVSAVILDTSTTSLNYLFIECTKWTNIMWAQFVFWFFHQSHLKEHILVYDTDSCQLSNVQHLDSSFFHTLYVLTPKSLFVCQIWTFIHQLVNKHFGLFDSSAVCQPIQHFSLIVVSATLPFSLYVQQCFFMHFTPIILWTWVRNGKLEVLIQWKEM